MKSWIKVETYDLSNNQKLEDTMYVRYTFLKNNVYTCLNPVSNDYKQEWNLSGNQLTIGAATYIIESLTDSTLAISSPGFRRIIFEDETYLNRKAVPVVVDTLDGEQVYQANRYITPRYEKEKFYETIQTNLEGYSNGLALTFIASYIVRKDGTVDRIKVIKSFSSGFDDEFRKQLMKTSKKWHPAVYDGQAVHSRLIYTIKYVASPFK
jgi:hypothetical protein